ncbi:peptide/nickel transport system permease protein/oligopeptide transport system permease protein [Streptosporangium album]|uniref:Peptide/nickel transport system permease protein/oligopeptide transport system permease protein n=1 Tax=Streptosporangium album TaxID=47479 RepID=A0A7W7W8C5_9ACTN|nr:ABC transporter permease [Streptosporangium album]MBB4937666.1 peptide/nickel transport system permease protein/oligopeptide transport system permease protein [Streptosporangium album]
MPRYVISRVLQAVLVLVGATLVIFILTFALPGDPVQALAGERAADPAFAEAIRARYHLDEPLLQQYGRFLLGVVQGDLGETYSGQDVAQMLSERMWVSGQLALFALAFQIIIGIGAGVVSALRRNGVADAGVRLFTLAGLSIPFFVTAFVLQLVVGVKLGWLPVAGAESGFLSYVMPGFVLGSLSTAYVARLTRGQLTEALREDYVRMATSKGLTRVRVVAFHALRNSLIPVVTFLGLEVGALLSGAVITESIFNLPGMGQAMARAVYLGERTTVVGVVTVFVLIYVVANLVVDLLYAVLDPRIRYA